MYPINVRRQVAANAIQSIRRKSGGTLIGGPGGAPGGGVAGAEGLPDGWPGLDDCAVVDAPLPGVAPDSEEAFLEGILLLI